MRMDWPTFFGNPHQHPCRNQEEFDSFIAANNGVRDCYRTYNGVRLDRGAVMVRYVGFDFDSETDLPAALRDMHRLRAWAEKRKAQMLPVFSAGKGFHGYLEFDPRLVLANQGLKSAFTAVQLTAVEEAGLETADKHLHGDLQRILRVPGTQHMKTKLYCNEVPWDRMDSIDNIVQYSRNARPPVETPPPVITLSEWMKRERIEQKSYSSGPGGNGSFADYKADDALLRNMLPRPCIHSGLMKQDVGHAIRFEAALTLAKAGMDERSIVRFFMETGRQYGWAKRDQTITEQQVSQVYRKRDSYDIFSCKRLRAEGYCVGKVCPIFKTVFGAEQ